MFEKTQFANSKSVLIDSSFNEVVLKFNYSVSNLKGKVKVQEYNSTSAYCSLEIYQRKLKEGTDNEYIWINNQFFVRLNMIIYFFAIERCNMNFSSRN